MLHYHFLGYWGHKWYKVSGMDHFPTTTSGSNWNGKQLFFFHWGIAALQCCASFCSTAMWISCIYLRPLLPPPDLTPPGHHGAPGWAPWATQQLHMSCLLHLFRFPAHCKGYEREQEWAWAQNQSAESFGNLTTFFSLSFLTKGNKGSIIFALMKIYIVLFNENIHHMSK